MTTDGTEKPGTPAAIEGRSRRGPGGRQPGAGRKPTHDAAIMRRTLRTLTTRRLARLAGGGLPRDRLARSQISWLPATHEGPLSTLRVLRCSPPLAHAPLGARS